MSKKMYKHPNRNFKTPEDLEKAFEEYKEFVANSSADWEGKKVPLIKKGFNVFCHKQGYGFVKQYFDNAGGHYEEFLTICEIISDEINANIETGALLNMYNASVSQRLAGLVDKQEVAATGNYVINTIPEAEGLGE